MYGQLSACTVKNIPNCNHSVNYLIKKMLLLHYNNGSTTGWSIFTVSERLDKIKLNWKPEIEQIDGFYAILVVLQAQSRFNGEARAD